MLSLRAAYALYAVAALAIGVQARPSSSIKTTHEKRDVVHAHWTKVGRADPDTPLTLRIGLKQRNLERAHEFVDAIAHPRSESYGKHWTPRQVIDMFSPSDVAITDTEQWLLNEGVPSDHITRTTGHNWIKVAVTVGKAESLLDTSYSVYENDNGAQLIACEAYSVPTAIQGHIDLVAPTIQFDEREVIITTRGLKKRDEALGPKFTKLPPHHRLNPADSLRNCSEATTPACLRALYAPPFTSRLLPPRPHRHPPQLTFF